jgi:hypothetical protein
MLIYSKTVGIFPLEKSTQAQGLLLLCLSFSAGLSEPAQGMLNMRVVEGYTYIHVFTFATVSSYITL